MNQPTLQQEHVSAPMAAPPEAPSTTSSGTVLDRLKRGFEVVRYVPAAFAGCDLRTLREHAPSERVFFNALGTMVLVVSILSGLALSVAVGFETEKGPLELWWVGAIWALVMAFGVERLLMQVSFTRKRHLLLTIGPRVALTGLLAMGLAAPLEAWINAGKVNHSLANRDVAAQRSITEQAEATFDRPKLIAQHVVARGLQRERRIEGQISRLDRKSLGQCGSLCGFYEARAASRRNDLEALRAPGSAHETYLRQNREAIQRLTAEKTAFVAKNQQAAVNDHGMLARQDAMRELERQDPAVRNEVWLIRAFLMILDLLPLTAKLTRMLTVDSPYERRVAADRGAENTRNFAFEQHTETAKARIHTKEGQQRELDQHESTLETGRIMDEREGGFTGSGPRTYAPVESYTLHDFTTNAIPHEREPVEFSPDLRRGGLVGLGLMIALTVVLSIASFVLHLPVAGLWLVLIFLAGASTLAVITRGFRRAPRWALRGVFATLIAGLTLPFAVIAMNI
jgi:hypothetical protein